MAELEVSKHTKSLINAAAGQHTLAHKLREIVLEMAIIVFAVSISIWFHSMGEHRHEQAQVRTFLLGLKRDLQSDMRQLESMVAFHHKADQHYAWLAALDPAQAPDPAPFEATYRFIGMNNFLIPRQGRYEGFKSAGKLTSIEDDRLLEQITEFYEYDLAKLKLSSSGWLGEQRALNDYVRQAVTEDDSLATRYQALTAKKAKLLLRHMVTYPQLYERAAVLKKEADDIVRAIDKAYPDQGAAH